MDGRCGLQLDVLRWARGHDCTCDAKNCAFAAEGGHLEVLKWAVGRGKRCTNAARGGAAPRGAAVGAGARLPVCSRRSGGGPGRVADV